MLVSGFFFVATSSSDDDEDEELLLSSDQVAAVFEIARLRDCSLAFVSMVAVDVVPRDVEGVAALRSSSRRFRFGAVGDPPGRGIGWAHVVVSICRSARTERACLKSFMIRSVATILSAGWHTRSLLYSSGWHTRSLAIRYCIDIMNMLPPS